MHAQSLHKWSMVDHARFRCQDFNFLQTLPSRNNNNRVLGAASSAKFVANHSAEPQCIGLVLLSQVSMLSDPENY